MLLARNIQPRTDLTRVYARKHQKAVSSAFLAAFKRIAAHAHFKKADPRTNPQISITQPNAYTIQGELKSVMDAIGTSGVETLTASLQSRQLTEEQLNHAVQLFLSQWQEYMTGQITDLAGEVQLTIQSNLAEAARLGQNPAKAATTIRDFVGLNPQQQGYVESYRAALENMDPSALDRALRNAKDDPKIIEAMNDEEPLDQSVIDKLVSRYADRWLAYRADMIARTELATANNLAQAQAMDALLNAGVYERTTMRKFWLTAMDELVCPICVGIPELNPDGVAIDSDFDTPEDTVDLPPAHPNCRCSVIYRPTKE